MNTSTINPGDLVYHHKHGTARFVGRKQIEGAEYLELEFSGADRIFVPVANAKGTVERVPDDGAVRVDHLRKTGPPPLPPRSLIKDRASRSSGGPGVEEPEAKPDPLLMAARKASPERRKTVARAAENWIARLIDLSRRNRLLFFQALKVRTVELSSEQAARALPLIRGEPVLVSRVFPQKELVHGEPDTELELEIEELQESDLGVIRRLQEIQKRGNEDFEERGLETVYFAYGIATWRPEDQGRPPEAPIVMVPIAVTGTSNRLALHPSGDIEINLVLTHVLEEQFGAEGLTEALEELLTDTDEVDPAQRAERIFDAVSAATASVPEFVIDRRAVIANFAFQKLAMVRDLQRWLDRIAGHDLVAGVAGDVGAKAAMSDQRTDVDPRELDKRRPDEEFLVMDADSSQLQAIAGILRGQSGVIIGPPGTGKSQTIANLIGELIANGKRVLFVAEKRAALEVVKSRLEQRGLGDLVLDLHGALSRKQIMSQFSTALTTVAETLKPRVTDLHSAFVARRQRLNDHVERLHRRREPTGYSAYEIFGHYLALEAAGATSTTRWKGEGLTSLTRDKVLAVAELLTRGAVEPHLFLRTSRSPWAKGELRDREAVENAVDLVENLSSRLLPDLTTKTNHLVGTLGLLRPMTLDAYGPVFGVLERSNQLFHLYKKEVLGLNLATLRDDLEPGARAFGRMWAWLTNRRYRAARRQLLAIRTVSASTGELRGDLNRWKSLFGDWYVLSNGLSQPAMYSQLGDVVQTHRGIHDAISCLRAYLPMPDQNALLSEVIDLTTALDRDKATARKLPALRGYENEIDSLGAGQFLAELRSGDPVVETWIPSFRFAWLASSRDQLLLEEPEMAVFNGREHDKVVEEFQYLDRSRLEVAVDRVKRAYAESVVRAANQHSDQHLLVRKQAALRSRHLPFRELVRRAPDVVTAVKPCWMASPLAVSQLLGEPGQVFDVVIFDEASQVLPEDAVTSILRGKSVVVAGDPNQLPPTQFFAADRDEDDSEPAEDTEGFESILDVMLSFLPQWNLDWHYRSRDERLIAFSNHYVYDDRLITFPASSLADPSLTHVEVDQGQRPTDADEFSSSVEVARVVDLILEHAERRPDESLGVIAMGIKHSNRIDAALARTRRDRPELEGFFEAHPAERFFVKNLERVQGDERDAIVLSIGYGKDSSGKLPYRFGPLLTEGGYRRLNVAVTRAKKRVTLVSSFSHEDMDPARSSRKGVQLLRLYLQYASTGGQVFGDGGPAPIERNEFEIQVQRELERVGMHIVPQFGASKYRIDMVVQHPEQPGRYVLAIECDGATYHSSLTARDRDRLRQEHLEARGWRFVRIWSTDWFTRRDDETARVLEIYRRAIQTPTDETTHEASDGPSARSNLVAVDQSIERGLRPPVARGLQITDYSPKELASLCRWIQSDGKLLTDDELVEALVDDLGFERRGRRIEVALREAIHLSKKASR
jgi:very-short-patch-repair endonuclease